LSRDEQIKIASVYTHICDLSGPAKDFDIAFTWSNLVRQEFMQQVADEQTNKLAITPFMVGLDNQAKFLKGEMFFQKCIVLHLFEIGNRYLSGELKFIIDILDKNYS
jgi:3'5'-cyclic nucleotide phosphodiesterase